jgi:hypothetical protein
MSDNPYSDDDRAIEPRKAGAVSVEESRAMAEVKAQVFMARQFPRDVVKATDRILLECDRLKLAEKAIYSFPRGTSTVSGPSIRLAEAIQRSWGNMMSGLVEVERNEKESAMLAYAWDLETNSMSRQEFKVPHTRDASEYLDGVKVKIKKLLTDDRDIYEMTANQGSRRKRACILAQIPGDVVEAAVKRCEKTLVAKVGDLATVIPKMVTKFAAIGVSKAMIEKRLGHRIEATQPAEVVQLGNIFTSIEDGMAVVKDFFEPEGEAKAPEEVVRTAGGAGTATKPSAGEPPEDLWAKILEYGAADDLPEAAKKEIQAAVDRDEKDPIILRALLNKVKAAYDGRKK